MKTPNIRTSLLFIAALYSAAAVAPAATILDVYTSPANGTDITTSTPATNVGGQLITGWVYGDETAIPGYTGQPIWANRVQIDNTSSTAITFDLYLGMWGVGPGGQPGPLQQLASTVPITINPGVSTVNVYTDWSLPAGDFWMGFAFTNVNSPSVTAPDLDALHFMLSNGPTVGSNTSHALLSSGVVGWTSNPSIGSTLNGNLAQSTELYFVPEPSSGLSLMGGLAVLAAIRRRTRHS
jgi:hypothetical protein